MHSYLKIKGEFTYEQDAVPEYRWFNGTVGRNLLGDKIDPTKVTPLNPPFGSIDDPKAKIWPFKIHRGKQPYDAGFNYLFPPVTGGTGGYWTTFDWDKSFRLGSEASKIPYSGKFGFAPTEMYWPLSHMVSTKEKALACTDCHGEIVAHGLEGPRLRGRSHQDRRAPMSRLAVAVVLLLASAAATPASAQQPVNPIHPQFAPLDAAGKKVRTAEEMDAAKTCGACHDAAYIAAHTDHKAPRSAATCVQCHVSGGKLEVRADRLDPEGKLRRESIRIGTPRAANCGACHGLVSDGHAPIVDSSGLRGGDRAGPDVVPHARARGPSSRPSG